MTYQPGPTGSYPAAPYPAPQYPAPRTNGWAIAALITAICGLILPPIICGHIALSQIRRTGEGGKVLAIIGMVLGYLELAVVVVLIVIAIGIAIWGWSQ